MRESNYNERRERYEAIQDAFVHRQTSPSPVIIEVEPKTDCDLACLFCPRDSLRRPRGRLLEDDFLRILENLGGASDKGMLLLSGFGEPMQHDETKGKSSYNLHRWCDFPFRRGRPALHSTRAVCDDPGCNH